MLTLIDEWSEGSLGAMGRAYRPAYISAHGGPDIPDTLTTPTMRSPIWPRFARRATPPVTESHDRQSPTLAVPGSRAARRASASATVVGGRRGSSWTLSENMTRLRGVRNRGWREGRHHSARPAIVTAVGTSIAITALAIDTYLAEWTDMVGYITIAAHDLLRIVTALLGYLTLFLAIHAVEDWSANRDTPHEGNG